jgi:hypothetical protein
MDAFDKKLRFHDLCDRHWGVTPGISAAFGEAARLCLDRHHASPQQLLLIDGIAETQGLAEWETADQRIQDGWANEDDATEYGAYGLALAAAELTRGLVAIRRAETRTGVDYYLGPPNSTADDLETSLRLEVSGTDKGSDAVIQARLREKLKQAESGTSNLPAIATVVGFAALKIVTADVEVK